MQPALTVFLLVAIGALAFISGSAASEEERGKRDCVNCDAYFPPPPYLWENDSTRKLKFCQKTKSVGTDKGSFYYSKTNQEEEDTYAYYYGGSGETKSAEFPPAQRSLIEEGNIMRSARSFLPAEQPVPIQKTIPAQDSVVQESAP